MALVAWVSLGFRLRVPAAANKEQTIPMEEVDEDAQVGQQRQQCLRFSCVPVCLCPVTVLDDFVACLQGDGLIGNVSELGAIIVDDILDTTKSFGTCPLAPTKHWPPLLHPKPHTHARTHAHTHTHTLTHSHTRTHSLTLSHSLIHSNIHTLSLLCALCK